MVDIASLRGKRKGKASVLAAAKARKCGGKVEGEESKERLDRHPRKSGGRTGSCNSVGPTVANPLSKA